MEIRGIGVDIIEIVRIRKTVEKFGKKFLSRIFHPEEIPSSPGTYWENLAGRFAGKEAVMKVLQKEGVGWKDIRILKEPHGSPYVELLGKGKEVALKLGVEKIFLTISHDGGIAFAFAIGVRSGKSDTT